MGGEAAQFYVKQTKGRKLNRNNNINIFEPILVDTSTWIMLINHNEESYIRYLYDNNIVPFITYEIILELIDVSIEEKIKRLTFFQKIPLLLSLLYNGEIGSIVDLRCHEYYFNLNFTGDIREYIRKKMTPVNKDLILGLFQSSNNIIKELNNRRKAIHLAVSLPQWKFHHDPKIRHKKLKDIQFKPTISKTEFEQHRKNVTKNIIEKSDKKDLMMKD